MPRPNQQRTVRREADLAKRIAYERERRGWSYEGLAARLTSAGCALPSSAIYKIEKSDPPRRITVDEAVAFAEVFQVTLEELLVPADRIASDAARKAMTQLDRMLPRLERMADEFEKLWKDVRSTIPKKKSGNRTSATVSVEQMNWISATKARLDESLRKINGE